MPWSIFQEGGGPGAAFTWSPKALRRIGAPANVPNEQLIYDWEVSEGGGGKYNPLNQGPDPSHPALSGGSQFGGGAADYISYSAGLTGFSDYLSMQNFSSIRSDLRANNPIQARTDIINSPWAASHYGGGSGFSDAPLPGHKSALKGIRGNLLPPSGGVQTTSILGSLGSLNTFFSDATSADFWERAGLIFFGAVLILIGIVILALPSATSAISSAASTKRAVGSLIPSGSSSSGGPTESETEDRSRRLSLAERNTEIGFMKASTQRTREERLSRGPRVKHKGNREPNPNPQHS